MANNTAVAAKPQSAEPKKNEVVAKPEFNTQLSLYTNNYIDLLKKDFSERGISFDEYSKQCVVSAMGNIYSMIHNSGTDMKAVNGSNLREILAKVAMLKVNSSAYPRECYFQVRSVNVGGKGADNWEKQIEFGIEGDGNDAILNRYGKNVDSVYPYWLVRSGDKFTYPKYSGIEITPPTWEPTGEGEVVRVVYPIKMKDERIEYKIAERSSALKNLYAHIYNNLMNETFGIAESRYKATPKQKEEIAVKKKELIGLASSINTLDGILDCPELQKYMSPAWTEPQSRESMIIRKMRNNITKAVPKDFGSAVIAEEYSMLDDTYREVKEEIAENANTVEFIEDAEVKPVVAEPGPVDAVEDAKSEIPPFMNQQ